MVYVAWVAGILACIITYAVIAMAITRLSLAVWYDKRSSVLAYLLFPCSAYRGTIGSDKRTFLEKGIRYEDGPWEGTYEEVSYCAAMFVVWPWRVIWSVLALCVVLPLVVIRGLTRAVTHQRDRREKRRTPVRLEKHARIEQLLEERSRIDVEVETLESDLASEEGARVYRLPSKVK